MLSLTLPNSRLPKFAPPPWPGVRAHRARPRPVWKNAFRYDNSCRATQRQGFSWASVAASAIAAPVANSINNSLFGNVDQATGLRTGAFAVANPTAAILAESTTSALVSATTRVAIVGGKLDWVAVSADALSSFVSARISRDGAIQQARAETGGRTARQQAALDYALANPVGLRSDSDSYTFADSIAAQTGYDRASIRNASYVETSDRLVVGGFSDADSAEIDSIVLNKKAEQLNQLKVSAAADQGLSLAPTIENSVNLGLYNTSTESGLPVQYTTNDIASSNSAQSNFLSDLTGLGQSSLGAVGGFDVSQMSAQAPTASGGGQYAFRGNEIYRAGLEGASQRTGFDPAQIASIINAEAATNRNGVWNPESRARTSSAYGLTQFLDGTWVSEAQRGGTALNDLASQNGWLDRNGRVLRQNRDELLQLRSDPNLSIMAAAEYMQHNIEQLDQRGLIPATATPDERIRYGYIAHHEGLGGAIQLLQGTLPETRATSLLNQQAGAQASTWRQNYGTAHEAYQAWLTNYAQRRIQPDAYRAH